MFSIIIPLYNKSPYIQRALDSVLNQSFEDYEVIVVNDGSTDGGEQKVKDFQDKVTLIHQANQGVSVARNTGIAESKYPWIAFLDADDFWHIDYLRLVAQAISENPDVGMIGTHYDSFALEENPALKCFWIQNYFKTAIHNTLFFTSATVLKKEFFDKNPGFDPQLKLGEDIDLWLRASLYFGNGVYIQNTLVYYEREDPQQATKKRYSLDQTLIPKILSETYFMDAHRDSTNQAEYFEAFKIKWVYFNLFPYCRLYENRMDVAKVLHQLPTFRYFLVAFFYRLPFWMFSSLMKAPGIQKLFRDYLKFCFRYIYT
ncbi:glycosyltransferase family A protein [Algoriphagus sp. NG3]|uniref:glycosyltransferase family 2 protein n=1 Tax=Algoriphagus sp. NG3 TaxID=3097546 RepID=UPI002A803EF1|nr:glycosyltransferase family A protein [Algoriphagus sp. NG3]WPR77398.1 glycosyltransferase family A protein [Algoriphagus sp. NG3]